MSWLADWAWVIVTGAVVTINWVWSNWHEQHRARDSRARVHPARAAYPPTYPAHPGTFNGPGVAAAVRARAGVSVRSDSAFARAMRAEADALIKSYGIYPATFVPYPPLPRDAEPTVGYAVGWRAWKIGDAGRDPVLMSVTRSTYWSTTEPLEADRVPAASRSHGIYAHKGLEHLFADDDVVPWYIYGPVALWGKTIETERGWRAQYGYPLALFGFRNDIAASDAFLEPLAVRYRVPWAAIDIEGIEVADWPSVATAEFREHIGSWVARGLLPAGVRT